MKQILLILGIGIILGAGTFLGQNVLPNEWGQLANCYSLWLLASFIGGMIAVSRRRAALYGVTVPVVALLSYYTVTVAIFHLGLGSLGIVAFWLAGGVTAGPLLGMLGEEYRQRGHRAWLAPVILSGLFLSEGLYQLLILGYWVGYVFFALGIGVFIALWRKRFKLGLTIIETILASLVFYGLYAYVLGSLASLLSRI